MLLLSLTLHHTSKEKNKEYSYSNFFEKPHNIKKVNSNTNFMSSTLFFKNFFENFLSL